MAENNVFDEWVVLELMGHRQLAGHAIETTIAGTGFIRLDMYRGIEEEPFATQIYSSGSIYCLTPTTEEIARGFMKHLQFRPITRYELPEPEDAEVF